VSPELDSADWMSSGCDVGFSGGSTTRHRDCLWPQMAQRGVAQSGRLVPQL